MTTARSTSGGFNSEGDVPLLGGYRKTQLAVGEVQPRRAEVVAQMRAVDVAELVAVPAGDCLAVDTAAIAEAMQVFQEDPGRLADILALFASNPQTLASAIDCANTAQITEAARHLTPDILRSVQSFWGSAPPMLTAMYPYGREEVVTKRVAARSAAGDVRAGVGRGGVHSAPKGEVVGGSSLAETDLELQQRLIAERRRAAAFQAPFAYTGFSVPSTAELHSLPSITTVSEEDF